MSSSGVRRLESERAAAPARSGWARLQPGFLSGAPTSKTAIMDANRGMQIPRTTNSVPDGLKLLIRKFRSRRVLGTQGYAEQAETLIPQYESISFEQSHRAELHLLPTVPSRILDIGAGTGRDAAWFAARGHSVLAIEPTVEFRVAGMMLHPFSSIEWLDDALPELTLVLSRDQLFDTIMLSAVWMHLDESERRTGMAKLASLLACEGILVLSLRHGPIPAGRRMFEVSAEETIALAGQYDLVPLLNVQTESIQAGNRVADVTWTRLVFKRPA